MFTGLIEALRPVERATRRGDGLEIQVDLGPLVEGARPGDSIAVNGACLTVTSVSGKTVAFDVVPETVRKTNLAELRPGDRVNIERPLRIGDRLGGHFVQGHVDGLGRMTAKSAKGAETLVRIEVPPSLARMMIPKGSVAVDGISLTIADLSDASFSVAVIPHTLENTTLGFKTPGDTVNIEVDMIGKWIAKLLGKDASGSITQDWLRDHGFT